MNAQSGEQKMQWAIRHTNSMGIAERFERAFQPFAGLNVVIALHLEAKTANLAYVVQGEPALTIAASNPITTQDVWRRRWLRAVSRCLRSAAKPRLNTRSTSTVSSPRNRTS